ncbi:hypothetical protein BDQ17DRAFT_1431491 [Cyathus striatus]|nr:hypothetical protein BDQ17DRAFT_1431491 [Cyathus striatus]
MPAAPLILHLEPNGSYGISYDIFTKNTERIPPQGWGARRSQTYVLLGRRLMQAGFRRLQYSDFVKDKVSASGAWMTMIQLRQILPHGKLEPTIKDLKMHYIRDMPACVVTEDIKLGGRFSRTIPGPTPRDLVVQAQQRPGAFINPLPAVPPPHFRPPKYTQQTPAAADPQNWLT